MKHEIKTLKGIVYADKGTIRCYALSGVIQKEASAVPVLKTMFAVKDYVRSKMIGVEKLVHTDVNKDGTIRYFKDDVGLYSMKGSVHKSASAPPLITNLPDARHYVAKLRGTSHSKPNRKRNNQWPTLNNT